MRFHVLTYRRSLYPTDEERNQAFLVTDNWDDWGQFATSFYLWYVTSSTKALLIGDVKIGQFGMGKGHTALESDGPNKLRSPKIPKEFESLGEGFFSVGQNDDYYNNLKQLGDELRVEILESLGDLAFDPALFERAKEEEVTRVSLFRNVTAETVKGQFRRLSHGKHRHIGYKFKYNQLPNLEMSFDVTPGSIPPTNAHIIIGPNGVGKTRLLNTMAATVVGFSSLDAGEFFFERMDDDSVQQFSKVISVSFSAFDEFQPLHDDLDSDGVRYCYIGLKKIKEGENSDTGPKSPGELSEEFSKSLRNCSKYSKFVWREIVTPVANQFFADTYLTGLHIWDDDHTFVDKEMMSQSTRIFDDLSAGHKVVILSLTELVENVAESTLVLIDEPEAHLHPPFLAAFMRALNELLVQRNAVAIIATHSPVVLQEVPKSCVWRLSRAGDEKSASRPRLETFGENVGILTNDVFHLEVSQSGFHKVIAESVKELNDYEAIIDRFNGQLGAEARALIRTLLPAPDPAEGDHAE